MNLEAKFILCPFCLSLEQPKSPAAHTFTAHSSPGVHPSSAEPLPSVLVPLAEQAALEQQDHLTRTEGMHRLHSDLVFHTTEPIIMVIFSEKDFFSVLLRAQAQLAHQMDTRVREQAHEEAGEDQMGQRNMNVLQMQCQDIQLS